jgi:hypothetical protein
VLVSAAPEIFYAEDTDGDGRADVRKTILAGFNEGNQQHRVNGFEYGLDNWIYAANGDSSGTIRSTATGQTANLRGHDLRFNPDTGVFDTVAVQTQFGRHRDDWGNWFGNNNPTWLWHYFLPEHYLRRNPDLAVNTTRQVLANYPNSTRVFPISRPQQRFNWPEAVNSLTSANSATPYRDELFGPDFDERLQRAYRASCIARFSNRAVSPSPVIGPETNKTGNFSRRRTTAFVQRCSRLVRMARFISRTFIAW